MVARVVGALALMVAAGGQAFAEEPAAKATVTPFQAMVPVLAAPPAPAQVPPAPESEIIEGDPRRKNRWQQADQIDRFEDFERIDLTRTEQFESVQGLERFEPAGGFIRPEPIERPAKLERPAKVQRIEKVERVDRRQRPERPERVTRRGRN